MPELSIASFNTHYGMRPHPPRTPYDVEAALQRLDADVIVIQELWRPDGLRGPIDDAAEAMGLPVHHTLIGTATITTQWPHFSKKGEGTIGVGVLTKLPMRQIGTIALGPTVGDPAPKRVAPHLEVEVDGSPLELVAVHLTSRLLHGPMLQLGRLAKAAPSDGPAVIAGDCNFWGRGVVQYLRGWRRTVRGRTWPARFPHSQIDHILVNEHITSYRGEVLPNLGSDHRPVRSVIAWDRSPR
ncbi:MAG: hypothetical protein FJW86_07285 [Actinobacteria bacterium]|nr:hypothetical protein [Actinomycetota bacterium]